MGNGMLSQEEIDALLSGSMDINSQEADEPVSGSSQTIQLTDMEKDAMGEIANISMGTAATTLSQLVGKRVEITAPKVDLTTAQKIFEDYPVPHVLIDVKYKKGIEGSNMLVLSREDGSIIVDLMMGGTGKSPTNELSDIQLSGISEAMNQMMGSAATSMSTMFNSVVDITPPRVIVAEEENEVYELSKNLNADEPLIRVSFRMIIEGIIDSVLIQVLPFEVAKGMADRLLGQMYTSPVQETVPEPQYTAPAMSVQPEPQIPKSQAPPPSPMETIWQPPVDFPSQRVQPTFVQPAQFAPLSSGGLAGLPSNLGLIYDVPLQVNVELGKAIKTIKEILDLGPGSVVELDRLAGEPVDMIVNGKLIAKCEVVVINETFGIRITEIVNPNERIDTLN
ncbi:Flagellar motor switch protein FliN [Dehalobacter sp. UNSWDHB]|jgi:flagellar motor switch protein FliN|uniref:flagellar motor switch phosphatase FliY n=1 Tax=unclassified Dehalobacter TaxID=2635733 RepID=UPI00028A4435|nr:MULTISPECIES: flagellar motor switch phosphatase FliY [unclassified Dehalobacter]AFV02556.1 Flagellar motor switch protein FliN [Dehalobacter sp. DCA]AFV05544.1 Flagellar motor switch protein FliN [Dehalobacter sp. CF]EQB19813.1 Flagellar motor switch protein FliN [Dehalobacter sp. UNSWDHB]